MDSPRSPVPTRTPSSARSAASRAEPASAPSQSSTSNDRRRAYYRVEGRLPVRLTPIAEHEVDRAIFELASPSALETPNVDDEVPGPLQERMRRLEEKLDLLLRKVGIDLPRPLGAADVRGLVFSGSGLAVEVEQAFRVGDRFLVEILLPVPARRLVRGVAEAVSDSPPGIGPDSPARLALAFRHMSDEDRDALVAHGYDLQRVALRAAQQAKRARP
jgi:hypothetical protein